MPGIGLHTTGGVTSLHKLKMAVRAFYLSKDIEVQRVRGLASTHSTSQENRGLKPTSSNYNIIQIFLLVTSTPPPPPTTTRTNP